MKKTKNEEKTVYYWRALSNRIGWIGIIILLIGLFVSMVFREVIYLLIIGGVGFLCFVASSILYYEMWRCPKCDRKLPKTSVGFGDINVCPYCGYKLRIVDEKVDKNLL